jgi:hypothetical protein
MTHFAYGCANGAIYRRVKLKIPSNRGCRRRSAPSRAMARQGALLRRIKVSIESMVLPGGLAGILDRARVLLAADFGLPPSLACLDLRRRLQDPGSLLRLDWIR